MRLFNYFLKHGSIIIFIALFIFSKNPICFSQNIPDPAFTPFMGKAYKIPARQKIIQHEKLIELCEMVGEISLDEINVPESYHKNPFPGLESMRRFGIVFNSEMTIAETAVYVFSLNSDDGSFLWIDDKMVLKNGGFHKMLLKSDTLVLEKGKYPIKIWYYQGFPDRYGLEFTAKYYKAYDPADGLKNLTPTEPKMVFNSTVLPFEINSYNLAKKGMETIDSLATEFNKHEIKEITISGHTDNTGSESFNKQLSLKRAETIKKELIKRLENKNIEFSVNGFGESQPVTTNETKLGRSKNRAGGNRDTRLKIEIQIQKRPDLNSRSGRF